jgi:DNA/RNA endonuclease YhcR with UshA esterase domain
LIVPFREGLLRIINAHAASARVATPTIEAATAVNGGQCFMRFPTLTFIFASIVTLIVACVLASSFCFAGSHAPWSNNSSSGKSGSGGSSSKPQNCVPIAEASKHVRKQTCVTGTVVRVEDGSHGVTFLDFCPEYRTCPFTVVVFPADRRKIGDVHQLQGRVVKIQGKIEEYDYRAEIVLHRAQQLGDDAKLLIAVPKDYDVERQGHYSAGSFRAAKTKKPKRTVQGPPVSIVDAEEP